MVPVVVYAAKSTADERGSIPTQLADCRAAIEREGDRTVVAEYQDEARSAFHGNRGEGKRAKQAKSRRAWHSPTAHPRRTAARVVHRTTSALMVESRGCRDLP